MTYGLYIDGRKDATKVMSKIGDKDYPSVELEDYYVLVGEEVQFYLSHLPPKDKTGKSIAMCNEIKIKGTRLENNLFVIGSDETATMTGNKSDCIALLETMFGRPLQ